MSDPSDLSDSSFSPDSDFDDLGDSSSSSSLASRDPAPAPARLDARARRGSNEATNAGVGPFRSVRPAQGAQRRPPYLSSSRSSSSLNSPSSSPPAHTRNRASSEDDGDSDSARPLRTRRIVRDPTSGPRAGLRSASPVRPASNTGADFEPGPSSRDARRRPHGAGSILRLSPPGAGPDDASRPSLSVRRLSHSRAGESRAASASASASDAASGSNTRIAPAPAAHPATRRRTIVEVDDSSDDDIVITGANLAEDRPARQPPIQVPDAVPAPRRAGDRGERAPSPERFRRAMNEIDEILARRRQNLGEIMGEPNDDRRRLVLSPDPPAAPPRPLARRPRIGLGGGGLYRGGERHRLAAAEAQAEGQDRDRHVLGPDFEGSASARRREIMRQLIAQADIAAANRNAGLRLDVPEIIGGLQVPPLGAGVGALQGLGMRLGMGMGIFGAGPAGGAGRPEDVQTILARVETPKYDPPAKGFARDFDMDQIHGDDSPIMVDDDGNVVEKEKKKPCLVCANCPRPLLVSSAYRSPHDRVWTLRCGHMIDSRCLDTIQTPSTPHQLASVDKHPETLGESPVGPRGGRRNVRRKIRKVEEKRRDEYTWTCPVDGCGKRHTSQDVGGSWVGKEGQGAIAVYA